MTFLTLLPLAGTPGCAWEFSSNAAVLPAPLPLQQVPKILFELL